MKFGKYNKVILEESDLKLIHANHDKMDYPELAELLGLRVTRLRTFLYELGYKKMNLEYWTDEQVKFLKKNYEEIGDTELAEIFEVKWKKEKGWSKKHIEKKRRYLKLKRTAVQIQEIRERNRLMGRWSNMTNWETRGVAPIGEKRLWNNGSSFFVVIKQKNGFVHYSRWLWEKEKGEIPPGMIVRNTNPDKINATIYDLILIDRKENGALNSKNRTPKELSKTIQLINKLQSLIQKSDTNGTVNN